MNCRSRLGQRTTPADHLREKQHDRDDQQNVDERADGIGPDGAEQPRNNRTTAMVYNIGFSSFTGRSSRVHHAGAADLRPCETA